MIARKLLMASGALAALAGGLALSGAAPAGEADPTGREVRAEVRAEKIFSRLDQDGDGRITRDEMEEQRASRHARLDADGDGVVTGEELATAMRAHAGDRAVKRFARLDANGDGRVDAAEFARRGDRRLARADADGDGAVTREEFNASFEARRSRLRR